MRFLLLNLLASLATLSAAEKPNIILLMADDLGYEDIGCYGNQNIKTPHLDALAQTGVRCTDFHSNGAVCSPTRAALFTGRYQQRSGIGGVVTAKSHRNVGLALEEFTFAEALKKEGYRTALFGKWHIGYPKELHPIHQGFDEFTGFVSGNVDYHRFIDQEGHYDWWKQDAPHKEKGYLTDLITEKGVDFISRNKDQPFCLVLTHGAPHYPLQGRSTPGFREVGKAQAGLRVDNPKAVYKEMIEVMDEGVGQIVAKLDALDLSENTLIIFCSDNGPSGKIGSSGILRGNKGQIYEGGHRVCGIFNWKGTLPSGQTCPSTLLTMDLFPSFLKIAGAPAVENLDGIDILPLIKNTEVIEREPTFWMIKNQVAVRSGKWKLIYTPKSGKVVLYDLEQDLSEKSDISKKHPEQTASLTKLAKQWAKEMQQYPKKS